MADPIQPLFDAVNISGVATNVTTLLVSFIGISVLFLGAYYVRKAMPRK